MRYLSLLLIILLLFVSRSFNHTSTEVYAQDDTPLRIIPETNRVRLEWQDTNVSIQGGSPQEPNLPLVEIGGVQMPARLVALSVHNDTPIQPHIERLASIPWGGKLASAEQIVPQSDGGELRPALAEPTTRAIPTTPVVVLREGYMRGQRIVVLAVSPVFEQDGALRWTTNLEVTVPQTSLFDEAAPTLFTSNESFVTAAVPPTNPFANRRAAKVIVTQSGLQRVTGAKLTQAGLDVSDGSRLRVYHNGVEIAAHVKNGVLGANDELRFYAPKEHNRWNANDVYWVVVESGTSRRMASRSAANCTVTARTTAFERGVWRESSLYDPTTPGIDGDHWYAADLKTAPDQPAATLELTLPAGLPPASGTTTLTVAGSAYTPGTHNLRVSMGSVSATSTWEETGAWEREFTLAANSRNVVIAAIPGTAPDGLQPDYIIYERPVHLDFGAVGHTFVGVDATACYRLSNTATGRILYDINDPQAPAIVNLPGGTTVTFQDTAQRHEYLLTGTGTLHTPEVIAHTPSNLSSPLNADVLYIAPQAFHSTLAPLVSRREAQGHTVRVVEVDAIYDNWSFGAVSPDAIRDFLRHAAATWSRKPVAVTLVGDGTRDPFDYTNSNRDGQTNHVNLMPPYLAMVDPWLGETACDTCYVQLDGDDPLDDPLPDIAIGRLPVKTVDELTSVVAKLVDYETKRIDPSAGSRNVYIADNANQADGTRDGAGDFAAFSDSSAALQPAGIEVTRVYYDPWQKDKDGSPLNEPWRESNAQVAYERTLTTLQNGAGIINYAGHSNVFQWAVTGPPAPDGKQHLLSLYDPDKLKDTNNFSIVLSMTCLTSAFQTPAVSGTTIDERWLLVPNGGAVAVWGPTGNGVAYGHDALQEGFYQQLWDGPSLQSTLGELMTAGYLRLHTNETCCQEALRTFVLLGDPLTPARVLPAQRTYLPITQR
ncbi:MAG: hypothetical protein GFH27_549445n13 [Chloroflexi bacterium AL-W]|nr:hypothetical protein [Chloroflexi bacterium AL-N1]NOK71669.1 hypothetical protein [Chloroflexi bacterium AL-N10]NOK79010.1 hypothetical protein [Chloroflexi bacterium AL-N5]NOK86444.1 hypothetical protein [Chloroflexi bacterium AL-W]NOK93410.1 hypothetical protein [Chloroflexi bacterium AL-N15]